MLQWRTAADKNIGESQNHRPDPNLSLSLLAIFGELDTPERVKANVRANEQIMNQAGRRDYTVKVYLNGSHNLMEVAPNNPNGVCPPQTIPTRFLRNDGRLDDSASAVHQEALGP